MTINSEFELLTGADLYARVIGDAVLNAEQYVWIATANLKNMHVPRARGYRPILDTFDRMAQDGVLFRIIHSDLPSRPFRKTLESLPRLYKGALELQVCPRSHWKIVIVDGRFGYLGSANFTGAGLGPRAMGKRNLELGITSHDQGLVNKLIELFDTFWIGTYCEDCSHKKICPDPIGG